MSVIFGLSFIYMRTELTYFLRHCFRLDEQIWGSEDEESDEEEEKEGDDDMNEETDAKGAKEDKENHNNLDSEQNEQGQGEDQDGLDATNGKNIFFLHTKFLPKKTRH